jgi:glutamate N-acetyltransferase/amino-acid N-acetyltransferase
LRVIQGGVTAPSGFSAASGRAGLRKSGKADVAIIVSDTVCNAAGVFTSNSLKAAPVIVTSEKLKLSRGKLRGVVVNSGNANALTGEAGIRDARSMCAYTSKLLGLDESSIVVCSTGIIGRKLPMMKIYRGIRSASGAISKSLSAGSRAAEAILTTDKSKKEFAVEQTLTDGRRIRIGGMTKGSGMIAPNMKALHATTLTFITTDAPVTEAYLRHCLERTVDETFNMVSIDGDQSTNDTVLLMANGAAGGPPVRRDRFFEEALQKVMFELAKMVAQDGEGATHLLVVEVINAASHPDARLAAKAVVSSSLFKCAVFGSDPNVGRIASAIGNSGCTADFSRLNVWIGSKRRCRIISGGIVGANSERAAEAMKEREVNILIDLGAGKESAIAMGCDLSYDYVRINSAYST